MAKMRVINADVLIKQCKPRGIADEVWKESNEYKQIISAPTIDAVEVVRCKDCKHYLNEHICMYFSRHGTIETSSYAYCAYGERREP